MKDGRKLYLEILRLIAFLCVMFNHTGKYGFELFTRDGSLLLRGLGIMVSNFSRTGVPRFFMISGALLIPKKEDLKTLLTGRVFKMLVILIVISFVYYIRFYIKNPVYGFSIKFFLETVYRSPFITPLWFMYVYIAFLLMLPMLRRMALNMSAAEFGYLILLCIVFWYAIPIINCFMGEKAYMSVPLLSLSIVYPLSGYYFDEVFSNAADIRKNTALQKMTEKKPVAALVLIVINGLICAVFTNIGRGMSGEWGYEYIESFIFIPAVVTFTVVRSLCSDISFPERLEKWIEYLGSCMFVTYLFEEMLREDICMIIFKTWGGSAFDILLFVPYAVVLLTSGIFLTMLIRLIPGLGKWV